MLSVYTNHSQKCPHRDDIAWRRCRCPKWIQGIPSEDHEFLRTSGQTRTWEQAEAKAWQLEEAARPGANEMGRPSSASGHIDFASQFEASALSHGIIACARRSEPCQRQQSFQSALSPVVSYGHIEAGSVSTTLICTQNEFLFFLYLEIARFPLPERPPFTTAPITKGRALALAFRDRGYL